MMNTNSLFNLSFDPNSNDDLKGWFFVSEDEDVATANLDYQDGQTEPRGANIVSAEPGETVIHAIKGNTLVNINVVVVNPSPEALSPGGSMDIPVIGTGWTAESQDDSIADVAFDEENSKFVITAGEGEGRTTVVFSNESTGCEFSIAIRVDGEAAG